MKWWQSVALVGVSLILGFVIGLVIVVKAHAEPLMIESHTENTYIRCGNMKFNEANKVWKISDCQALTSLVDPVTGTSTPVPTATAMPTPTQTKKPESAIPCEPLGGLKTFARDETKRFCFNVDGSLLPTYPFFEIQVVNLANWNCTSLEATLFSPTGDMLDYSYGVEPDTVGYRDGGGQFEEYVHMLLFQEGCNNFKFSQNP